MNPFDNLSYSEFVPTFVGTPVDDIKAMNLQREKNYQDVLNSFDITRGALNGIKPFNEKDTLALREIQDELAGTIDSMTEQGDLENQTLNFRKYVNDLSNNRGLNELQSAISSRDAQIAQDMELVKEGKMSMNDFQQDLKHGDLMYGINGGWQKNPTTGRYEANYSKPYTPQDYNAIKDVMDVFAGQFKADGIEMIDPETGRPILQQVGGDGQSYLYYVDGEEVSPQRVQSAIESYLATNPKYKENLTAIVRRNFNNQFLTEEGYVEPTSQDVVNNLINSKSGAGIMKKYGIDKLDAESVENALSAKGISAGQLIQEAIANEYQGNVINALVGTQAYKDTNVEFKEDWMYRSALDYEAALNKKAAGIGENGETIPAEEPYVSLITNAITTNKINPADMRGVISNYNQADKTLKDLTTKLNSINLNDPNLDPNSVAELRAGIEQAAYEKGQFAEQINFVRNEIKSKIPDTLIKEQYNKYIADVTKSKSTIEKEIKKLQDKGTMSTLDYIKLNNLQKELQEITVISEEKFTNKVLDNYAQNEDGTVFSRNLDKFIGGINDSYGFMDNNDTLEMYINRGSKGIYDKIGAVKNQKVAQNYVTISSQAPLKYNQLAQISEIAKQKIVNTPDVFKMGNKNLHSLVEDQFDLESDEVDWEKSTVTPLFAVKDGKPLYAVSIFEHKDSGDASKGTNAKGSITVTMDGSNDNSVMVDIAQKEISDILSRADVMGNGELSFANNQDADNYKVLSKFYTELSPLGKSLDDINIYIMNAGDKKEWKIPGSQTVDIVALGDAMYNEATDVGDLNYAIKLKDGRTWGTNSQGQLGYWDDATLAKPITYDTAAEIKADIGGRFLQHNANKKENNSQRPANPYLQNINKKGTIAVTHNNPGNIKYGEFAKKYGAVEGKSAIDGGTFAIFPDIQTGLKARTDLLLGNSYKNLTVDDAMKRWSNSDYGGEIYPEIKNKTISQLTQSELDELIKRQTKREDNNMYNMIYGS